MTTRKKWHSPASSMLWNDPSNWSATPKEEKPVANPTMSNIQKALAAAKVVKTLTLKHFGEIQDALGGIETRDADVTRATHWISGATYEAHYNAENLVRLLAVKVAKEQRALATPRVAPTVQIDSEHPRHAGKYRKA